MSLLTLSTQDNLLHESLVITFGAQTEKNHTQWYRAELSSETRGSCCARGAICIRGMPMERLAGWDWGSCWCWPSVDVDQESRRSAYASPQATLKLWSIKTVSELWQIRVRIYVFHKWIKITDRSCQIFATRFEEFHTVFTFASEPLIHFAPMNITIPHNVTASNKGMWSILVYLHSDLGYQWTTPIEESIPWCNGWIFVQEAVPARMVRTWRSALAPARGTVSALASVHRCSSVPTKFWQLSLIPLSSIFLFFITADEENTWEEQSETFGSILKSSQTTPNYISFIPRPSAPVIKKTVKRTMSVWPRNHIATNFWPLKTSLLAQISSSSRSSCTTCRRRNWSITIPARLADWRGRFTSLN